MELKSKREYIISFVGLKLGFHDFDFEIDDAFFEKYEYSMIQKGELKAHLQLEKKETMFIALFTVDGFIHTTCDRCTDDLKLPIHGEFQLIYKFGHEESHDENLIVLHPDEYQLDVSDAIYELIIISLPNKVTHPQGACNPEMMELINQHSIFSTEEEEEDEDWEDDEDFDEDDSDDDADDELDNDDEDFDPNQPIDPRWSILKNLN